jgi:hypothetical protein
MEKITVFEIDEINNSIIYEKKNIFVLFGNQKIMNDIWDYFQHIGAVELEESRILQGPINCYLDEDDFYKKAYAKFLVVRDFVDFKNLSGKKIKAIVSGDYFNVGQVIWKKMFIERPPSKKLIIFAGETIPDDTILSQGALAARTKIYHL